MMRPRRAQAVARAAMAAALLLASTVRGFPHGASKGIHLHVSPEPACPGASLRVEIDAVEAMTRVLAAAGQGKPSRFDAAAPSRRMVVTLRAPDRPRNGTINVAAEATAVSGRRLRASAIVRLEPCANGGGAPVP
jgi:hypothetical protein